MELTAAVLAAKTSIMLREELDVRTGQTFFWTDSQVVLGYIKNESRKFKIFVANRVQQIQDVTDVMQTTKPSRCGIKRIIEKARK